MKRFHVHVAVDDLAANIRFYSTVFGTEPAVVKDDYAKWMLEDPRLNFAISSRGARPGVDHLGLQVDSDEALAALREQVERAEIAAVDQQAASCCYAKSNKYWITDPQGIAWETFHSLSSIPVYGADTQVAARTAATSCCTPGEEAARPAPAARASACCR